MKNFMKSYSGESRHSLGISAYALSSPLCSKTLSCLTTANIILMSWNLTAFKAFFFTSLSFGLLPNLRS